MDLYVYSTYDASKGGVPSAGLFKIGYGSGNEYTYTKINTSGSHTFSNHSIVVMQYYSWQSSYDLGTVCKKYKDGVDEVLNFIRTKQVIPLILI